MKTMPGTTLSTELRRSLEKTIREARQVAEVGAQDAIRRLGIAEASAPIWLDESGKALRRRLRAHARSLGDAFDRTTERQEVDHLVGATAYAHWHRMLFARFLAERDLLRHPEHDVAISLADCEELAAEENLPDRWAVAERYAAAMLPGVFLPEDPVLALEVAPEHTHRLQTLVQDLDVETFKASDSLGWTYQFWRGAEKDAVNKSGVKIGADELPAVTQLFTEPYMVRFLLHNTLGAWWAGKVLAQRPGLAATAADEVTLRTACALPGVTWEMLRFIREGDVWRPAAGIFPGWPDEAKAITLLDPCCGSGHFLTEALPILAALRQAQEGLSARNAIAAVLRDNLFGLEIDGRCVQIAAFAVALNAWALGGWQTLPQPHIAWVGSPPPLPRQDFVAMANGEDDLRIGLAALHDLFSQAPILGSLIEPTGGDLMSPQRLGRIEPLLDKLLSRARKSEPEMAEGVVAARGMADAALILSRRYTLQSTNVPFLGRGKQDAILASFIEREHPDAKADLATAMLSRMLALAIHGGVVASVSPQNWLFLSSYRKFREKLLKTTIINGVAALGPRAFETIGGEVVNTSLIIFTKDKLKYDENIFGIDANLGLTPINKKYSLEFDEIITTKQNEQISNPDCRIVVSRMAQGELLSAHCTSFLGLGTGDIPRYFRGFSEVGESFGKWAYLQGAVDETSYWSGCEGVVAWDYGVNRVHGMSYAEREQIHNQDQSGQQAWGKMGVSISLMSTLRTSLFTGSRYEKSTTALIPKNFDDLDAIWCYVSSERFNEDVRKIDQKVIVASATVAKVPFDLSYWKQEAATKYPDGLPKPYSDDPTQWLFHGHPAAAKIGTGLHVALARLSGYSWPAENDADMRLSAEARELIAEVGSLPNADNDGILCLPPVAGERPLAERLRAFLAAVFGAEWSEAKERQLIAEADERFEKKSAKDQSLEGWLRERAFRQHCKLFHDRPFLWQVWDGMKDGFSAFLHYHRLDRKRHLMAALRGMACPA